MQEQNSETKIAHLSKTESNEANLSYEHQKQYPETDQKNQWKVEVNVQLTDASLSSSLTSEEQKAITE